MARENMVNQDAESAVVGALIADPTTLPQVLPILGISRDKFGTKVGIIYETIITLDNHGIAVDPVTIRDYLSRRQAPNRNQTMLEVLGENYLQRCLENSVTPSNAPDYAKSVQDSYTSRRIVTVATKAIDLAFRHQDDPEQALAILEQEVSDIRLDRPSDIATGRDMAAAVQQLLARKVKNPDYAFGFRSNIVNLDNIINFEPGRLITIAGRPGLGKTQIATYIAFQLLKQGKPVYFISMEMSRTQMMYRLIALATGINSKTIKGHPANLTSEQLSQVQQELGAFLDHRYPLYFTFGGKNVLELRAHARQVKAQCRQDTGQDLAAVVVDYAQLIPPTPLTASARRDLQVGEVSRTLKLMSSEDDLNCPVFMVSQLSRNSEQRTNKRPVLSDLRDSGSIEQDSDIVIFTFPTLQYASETERKKVLKDFEDGFEPLDLIVGKNRDGETGVAKCAWRKDCGHVRSLTRDESG